MIERGRVFEPNWVSPPGETIADLLEERAWTQVEFAERTGFTTKHISLLINGKAPISEETALKLERVLGSTARFWLNREAHYRECLARADEAQSLHKYTEWLDDLPLKEMIRHGWVRPCRDGTAQVAECLKFFGVASVDAWKRRYAEPVAAFRSSKKFLKDAGSVAAWLRQGERIAERVECRPFDKHACRDAAEALRRLTNEADPNVFVPKLSSVCAEFGIAVVFEPAPSGCPVSGAAQWLSTDKALLMLSLRHKSNDHLWFSFFHEMGHLILHGKKMLFIDAEDRLDDEHEEEADKFASDLLIPPKFAAQLQFVARTEAAVAEFATKLGIPPGIVVGRMQREGWLPWTHLNKLKQRYRWAG